MNTLSQTDSQPSEYAKYTIIMPVYNEETAAKDTIIHLMESQDENQDFELLVVNDGSTDGTLTELKELQKIGHDFTIISHPTNQGYGAALKTGIRNAANELIVITDGDGSYPNEDIPKLVALCSDQDMVVGARVGANVSYSKIRAIPKIVLKAWVSWIAGRNVPDINSGLRVFRKSITEQFFGILPNSFSFTITITLAMLTNYRRVLFEPIDYKHRSGKSKIKPIRDTLRFLTIILRTGTYFAPMRIFMPIFGISGLLLLISLGFDLFVFQNLTDKSVMLLMITMNIGMFGLLADMIDKRSKP